MPSEELYLQDIVKSIDDIGRFLDGTDEAKFLADEILQNAVLMKLVYYRRGGGKNIKRNSFALS
ncbi:MAG TPA: hypothetical protein PKY59_03810 [Pyrinomonadaceae bacterium]|nr:hypothetical protein [Pyrinomonadaceae bacterium]